MVCLNPKSVFCCKARSYLHGPLKPQRWLYGVRARGRPDERFSYYVTAMFWNPSPPTPKRRGVTLTHFQVGISRFPVPAAKGETGAYPTLEQVQLLWDSSFFKNNESTTAGLWKWRLSNTSNTENSHLQFRVMKHVAHMFRYCQCNLGTNEEKPYQEH